AHELAAGLELIDRASTDIEHRLTQPTDELVRDCRNRTAVRDLPFDALRDELVIAGHIGLEVAVLRVRGLLAAGLHRTERTHAAVLLELLASLEDDLSRRLVGSGQERAEHHGIRPGDQRLGDITRVLQTTVGDHRDAGFTRSERGFVNGRHLRHTDAGYDTSGADGSGTHPDLDGIHARID